MRLRMCRRRCCGAALLLALVCAAALVLTVTHRRLARGIATADLSADHATASTTPDANAGRAYAAAAATAAPAALRVDERIPAHVLRRDSMRACTMPARGGSDRLACALLHFQHTVQTPFLRAHFPALVVARDDDDARHNNASGDAAAGDAAAAAAAADVYVTHDGRVLDCRRYASPIAATSVAAAGSFVRSTTGAKRRFFVPQPQQPPPQQPQQQQQQHTRRPKWLAYQVKHAASSNGGLADRLIGIVMALQLALISNRALVIDHAFPVPLTVALVPNALRWPDRLPPTTTSAGAVETLNWIDHLHPPEDVQRALEQRRHAEGIIFRGNINLFAELPVAYKRAYGLDPAHHLDSYWSCFFSYLFAPTDALQSRIIGAGLPLLPSRPYASQLPTPSYLARALDAERPIVCAQLRMGGRQPSFNDSVVINDVGAFPWPLVHRWVDASFAATGARVLFVASDSDDAIRALDTHYHVPGSDRRVVTIRGDVMHVDRSALHGKSTGALNDAFLKVVADNWVLGTCKRVLMTASGFGRSGVWRGALPYAALDIVVGGTRIEPFRRHPFNPGTVGDPHPSLP